jgi:hypothetical protein
VVVDARYDSAATVAGESDARRLVDKLWSYCNVLRDDGVSTIDYVEQLTYLLFLKMAHEREVRPVKPERIVPPECSWQRLLDADGDELEITYRHILEDLGKQRGVLGVVFRKAQNKIQDPANLKRLVVDLIGKENCRRPASTSRATPTRNCSPRARRTSRAAPASTSRRGR